MHYLHVGALAVVVGPLLVLLLHAEDIAHHRARLHTYIYVMCTCVYIVHSTVHGALHGRASLLELVLGYVMHRVMHYVMHYVMHCVMQYVMHHAMH